MVLLRSCCCRLSLRKGSFACGIYTLVFYTMMIATGACHISSELLFSEQPPPAATLADLRASDDALRHLAFLLFHQRYCEPLLQFSLYD
ncbi:hypothetical protein V5799_021858 [Amblyomma americanum]|uniref:Uncharacterized protein n=1 Tax=Amblyomma americanum TaxID=6943 RepID=A0AAQ4FM57_AMBAM